MTADFYNKLNNTIDTLRQNGTLKKLQYLQSPMSARVAAEGYGEVVIMCSNNYLGLSDKPEIVEAGVRALEKYGAGGASVRFICGTFDIHRQLEQRVADFLHTEAALTYTSCWNANTALIPALLEPGDTIISDELNHASIIDGCRAASKDVKKLVYKHANMFSLEEQLKSASPEGSTLIITDGVFSMEGDIAPLPEIVKLADKYGALVMVDDSHATGVIGATGRGTEEFYGMSGKVDIITGTFGKALGGAGGGFVAARKSVIEILIQRSRPHLFSNSLPPVLSGIAIAAVDYLDSHPAMVQSLGKKTAYMRDALKKAGFNPLEGNSAIIPIIVGETSSAIAMAGEMLKKGVYAIGFGFPVVPEGKARIRFQVSDALSYEDLDKAVRVISEVKGECCK